VWAELRSLDFQFLSHVRRSGDDSSRSESAKVSLGSVHTVVNASKDSSKEDTVQKLRLIEFSEARHQLTYELVESQPPVKYSSMVRSFQCRRVTQSNQTFVEAITDFSSDADESVLTDAKYKSIEILEELARHTKKKGKASKKRKKNWMPLESNPDIMNKYVKQLGVANAEFVELFAFEPECLDFIPQPALAVLVLFPLSDKEKKRRAEQKSASDSKSNADKKMYFVKQTVSNACGTVGVIHAVLNNRDSLQLDPGKFFHKFYASTKEMTWDSRAEALENNDEIEEEHEEVANSSAASTRPNDPALRNLHFMVLVWHDNAVYELDGRLNGPFRHEGRVEKFDFLVRACEIIKGLIARAGPDDCRFNACVLVNT